MKKIAIIFSQSPFRSALSREGQDMLLALCAVEHQLTVIYLADAVLQLLPTSPTAALGCKDFTPAQALFALYDVHQVVVCQQSVAHWRLSAAEFRIAADVLASGQITQLLQQQQHILRF